MSKYRVGLVRQTGFLVEETVTNGPVLIIAGRIVRGQLGNGHRRLIGSVGFAGRARGDEKLRYPNLVGPEQLLLLFRESPSVRRGR